MLVISSFMKKKAAKQKVNLKLDWEYLFTFKTGRREGVNVTTFVEHMISDDSIT